MTARLAQAGNAVEKRLTGWIEAGRHDFSTAETFVAFAGFPRSGHTLVGSLLTAHPDAVVAHELNALELIRWRVGRRALFGSIVRADRRFAEAGSTWTGYDYSVPGQWQGRYRDLKVIGDKKGGGTARYLFRYPDLFDRLRRTVTLPVKFVVVTRHPLDNIARMATKTDDDLAHHARSYFEMADAVEWLVAEADCLVVRHEDFTDDPAGELGRITAWLGLAPDASHLSACAALVRSSRPARDAVTWSPDVRNVVEGEVARRELLAAYR